MLVSNVNITHPENRALDILSFAGEGEEIYLNKCYAIMKISYIFHTLSSVLRRFRLSCLKCEGVKPVTFLNWFDKCATLL